MDAWGNKLFTDGGREILIKAVIQAIPTYAMSCVRISTTINKKIENMCANFWWGASTSRKRIHWKKWQDLTLPKDRGGMGFRDLTLFNKALLAKQVWRLIINPDSPVARMFKARYYKHMDILEAPVGNNPSFIWRSLCWGRESLSEGLFWKIGKGNRVNVFKDNWIPEHAKRKLDEDRAGVSELMVNNFFNNQGEWNLAELKKVALSYELEAILRIHISGINKDDRRFWIYEKRGHYTVKAGY